MNRRPKPSVATRNGAVRPYHRGWAPSTSAATPSSSPSAGTPRQTPSPSPSPDDTVLLGNNLSPGRTLTASTPPLSTPSTALPQLPSVSPDDSPTTTVGGMYDVSSPDIRSFLVPRSSIGRATPMMASPDSTHLAYLTDDMMQEPKHMYNVRPVPIQTAIPVEGLRIQKQSPPSTIAREDRSVTRKSSRSSSASRRESSRKDSGSRSRSLSSRTSSSSRGAYDHFGGQSDAPSPPPLPCRPSPSIQFSIPSPSFQLSPFRYQGRSPSPPVRTSHAPPSTIPEEPSERASSDIAVISVSPTMAGPTSGPASQQSSDQSLSISSASMLSSGQSPDSGAASGPVMRSVSPTNVPLPPSTKEDPSRSATPSVKSAKSSSRRKRRVPSLRVEIPGAAKVTQHAPPVPLAVPQQDVPQIHTPSVLGFAADVAPASTHVPSQALITVESASSKLFTGFGECLSALVDTGLPLGRDPPEIVVIGPAGAGKTALVSDLIGLALPEDRTQCPVMFTLTRSTGAWGCQLTLIRHRDPLSATFENVTGEPFGQALRDPAELPHALRSASLQLVGPHAAFSRDVICVNVHAPDAPELCVFDLPGMRGDRETRRLAKLCAQSPRTLILLAMSCEGGCASARTDRADADADAFQAEPDNLSAVRLAREVDPAGGRTLGVLTRAERMEDVAPWARMLRGEEHAFMHGWFCPRESSALQQVLGVHAHHRVGRPAFVRKLDAVLSEITRQRIIELQSLATERLDAISDELTRIPESPSTRGDARNEVFKLLLQFSGDVSQLMSSVSTKVDDTAFWSTVRSEQQILRKELQRCAPKFIPWERACSVVDLQWLEDPAGLANEGAAEFAQRAGEELFVDDVATLMTNASGVHFHGRCACSAQQQLLKGAMAPWTQPTHAFVQAVVRRVESELHERVRRHFGAYAHGGLDTHIYSLALSQIREHRRRLTAQLDELLESARVPVAVGGAYEHFFSIFRAHFRDASLAAQGHGATVSILRNGGGAAAEALEVLRSLGFPGDLTESDLLRLFPAKSHEAERALDTMASVRAYYHVATQCFLDTAVQTTVSAFLNPLARDLGAALVDGLEVGDQDRAMHWLSRAPDARQRKADLEHRRVHIQRGVDLLARLSFAR